MFLFYVVLFFKSGMVFDGGAPMANQDKQRQKVMAKKRQIREDRREGERKTRDLLLREDEE